MIHNVQNHIVFIEGNWYGTDFNGLTPPWDDNMSYSFHKYWGETDYSTIMSYLSMSSTYNIPPHRDNHSKIEVGSLGDSSTATKRLEVRGPTSRKHSDSNSVRVITQESFSKATKNRGSCNRGVLWTRIHADF